MAENLDLVVHVVVPESILETRKSVVEAMRGLPIRPGVQSDYEAYTTALLAVRQTKNTIVDFFAPMLAAADNAKKAAEASKKAIQKAIETHTIELDEAESIGKAQVCVWLNQTKADQPDLTPPKVRGITIRETHRAEVSDFETLVCYVADHLDEINLLQPNMTLLNERARSARGNTKTLGIPGVDFVSSDDVALSNK